MAIMQARIKINGVWVVCTYNSATGKYEGNFTAPATTSFHKTGGYYPSEVEITNDAGTVVTRDSMDPVLGNALRLTVRERINPVITLQSPTSGAFLQNNKTPIVFSVTDEEGGSGVNLSSVVLKVDGAVVSPERIGITNGYKYTYTPASVYIDGLHTLSIAANDNDGNAADNKNINFTIDTLPPNLMITAPLDGAILNIAKCTLAGTTNDITSSPVVVSITLNGSSVGSAPVGVGGKFTKELTLKEGINTIVSTSVDGAGRATTVTRTVRLDTTIPSIRSVRFEPNPVDVSSSVMISLEVS